MSSRRCTNAATRARIGQLERSDLLTGLLSTEVFDRRLRRSVELANVTGLHLSLVMLQIDGFGAIAAGHGHRTAGFVLAEVARRLENASRVGDVLGRVGDGRFGRLLSRPMATWRGRRRSGCARASRAPGSRC